MEPGKTVSTIIPCYNAEKYIADCVISVLKQDYPQTEIICVNDGSTDNTLQLLEDLRSKYSDKILVVDIENAGAPHARNVGLQKASGDYVQFLDADDLITSDKFSKQVKGLEQSDMVVSDRIIKNEDLSVTTEEISFAHIRKNPLQVAVQEIIITGNPVYRIDHVRKIKGYREDLLSAQDWDFHIRMVLSGARIKYVPGNYFVSRRVGGSISSNWKSVSEQCCRVIKDIKTELLDHPLFNDSIRDHIAVIYYNSAIMTEEKSLIREYKNELLFWSKGKLSFISNPSKRLLAAILGINNLIGIERMRN